MPINFGLGHTQQYLLPIANLGFTKNSLCSRAEFLAFWKAAISVLFELPILTHIFSAAAAALRLCLLIVIVMAKLMSCPSYFSGGPAIKSNELD